MNSGSADDNELEYLASDAKLLSLERLRLREGFCFIAGIDEAGRGPLAGPVVAAAVRFPVGARIPGRVNDSKQLSEAAREELNLAIRAVDGVDFAIAEVDVATVDALNILGATHLAMRRAAEQLRQVDCLLVDGLPVRGLPRPAFAVVGGDGKSASIAAASILAKVWRDHRMQELDREYPGYGFAGHKGYGTAAHLAALRELGACPIHRRSFAPVKRVLGLLPEQPELFGRERL